MSLTLASETSASIAMRAASFSSALNARSCSAVSSPAARSTVSGSTRDSKRGPRNGVADSRAALRASCSAASSVSESDVRVVMAEREEKPVRRSVYQLPPRQRVMRRERSLARELTAGRVQRPPGMDAELGGIGKSLAPIEARQARERHRGRGVLDERLEPAAQQSDVFRRAASIEEPAGLRIPHLADDEVPEFLGHHAVGLVIAHVVGVEQRADDGDLIAEQAAHARVAVEVVRDALRGLVARQRDALK